MEELIHTAQGRMSRFTTKWFCWLDFRTTAKYTAFLCFLWYFRHQKVMFILLLPFGSLGWYVAVCLAHPSLRFGEWGVGEARGLLIPSFSVSPPPFFFCLYLSPLLVFPASIPFFLLFLTHNGWIRIILNCKQLTVGMTNTMGFCTLSKANFIFGYMWPVTVMYFLLS